MNWEKALSIIMNRMCLVVGVFAILPIAIAAMMGNYLLFKFFESEGAVLPDYAWTIITLGVSALMFVLLILFTSIMESFDKELKKLYHEIKKQKKLQK